MYMKCKILYYLKPTCSWLLCCIHTGFRISDPRMMNMVFQEKVSKWENQLADLIFYTANMIFMDHIDPLTLHLKAKEPIDSFLCCAVFCTGIKMEMLAHSFSSKNHLNINTILKVIIPDYCIVKNHCLLFIHVQKPCMQRFFKRLGSHYISWNHGNIKKLFTNFFCNKMDKKQIKDNHWMYKLWPNILRLIQCIIHLYVPAKSQMIWAVNPKVDLADLPVALISSVVYNISEQ